MTWLVEIGLYALPAAAAGAAVRAMTRRRATRRAADLADSGMVRIPCRVSWPAGTGKKAFVYGKVTVDAAGELTFARRGGRTMPLPRSAWIHTEPSWRTGLVNLRYAVPGRGDVRMLLSEKDAETVAGLLVGAR